MDVYRCSMCQMQFSNHVALRRHEARSCQLRSPNNKRRKVNSEEENSSLNADPSTSTLIRCNICQLTIPSNTFSAHLKSQKHKCHAWVPANKNVEISKSAFRNRIISYKITNPNRRISVLDFMADIKELALEVVRNEVIKHKLVKMNCELFGLYILPEKNVSELKSHNSGNIIVDLSHNLDTQYIDITSNIENKASEFLERQSGWMLVYFTFLEININKFNPLRASSYMPLPKEIASKKAIVNIKNDDQFCFAWSLTAAVCSPTGSVSASSSYPHFSTIFDYSGVEFPMSLKSIEEFESRNNLSINVYGLEKIFETNKSQWQVVGPLHYTKNKKSLHINLLLLDDSMGNFHYCLIKNLSRLLSQQLSAHHGAKFFCDGCLTYFNTKEKLDLHTQHDCNYVRAVLPTTEVLYDEYGNSIRADILKFKSYSRQLRHPVCIYCDFECLLKPVNQILNGACHIERKFQHIPCSFSYLIKCSFDETLSKVEFYRGTNAAGVFVSRLEKDCKRIYDNYLKKVVPMKPLSREEEEQFKNATHCYICDKPFESEDDKVRDHCHISGAFRGICHSAPCNLNYKIPMFIPVVFHNLKNYDAHLFIKELGADHETINIIPLNFEKYVSFTKSVKVDSIKLSDGSEKNKFLQLRFIDSFQFLPESLDKLASTLEIHQFREIRKYFPEPEKFTHMMRKGVFPYTYVDSLEKLEETCLPDISKFYNEMRDEEITEEEYKRAHQIFSLFECETLGDFYDIYLLTDVLLLADIFENYRDLCIKNYKLDACQYLTGSSISWDAMLKYTKVELELLTDIDMLHFFKQGIRGGVSTCVSRKAEANNRFLSTYDDSKPTTFIMYLDATSLYGHVMSSYSFPSGGFSWLTEAEIETMYSEILSIENDSPIGYVFEVDLSYPERLHSSHNCFPFAPENITPEGAQNPKLIPNLYDKQKYVIHYIALKQCMRYGLELKKIHRGIKFNQSRWLKNYIELNTNLRNAAKNEFEKKLFKNKINCIYGKTMENVEKRVNIKLATQFEKNSKKNGAENYIAKPNFKTCKIFSENLVGIQLNKLHIKYDRPIYVGFCILDIAKTVIYEFFYGYLKRLYGDKVSLLYTDTDSLIIHVETPNFYSDMVNNLDHFDTSNYKQDNIHNIPPNESVTGRMKDEFSGRVVSRFIGTGSKAYCIQVEDDIVKKAKGVKKTSVEKQLDLTHYVSVINEETPEVTCTMYIFRSHLHIVYTEHLRKVALSSKDDKRFIIPSSTKTLAWGHKDIPKYQNGTEAESLDMLIRLLSEQGDEGVRN